ncbi:sensor histidine kinase [Luteolibacter luteus]|uniref:Sensor histidine kinase n=1 Tax=Luteolibacter luteus TaxID=2728835 RepID=A0A858RKY2_9BACT|nr:sensor histidine kinase [Luteolibacter luteus]QJE97118.1 sensor histidine kinase [Luteolibacter luteus]
MAASQEPPKPSASFWKAPPQWFAVLIGTLIILGIGSVDMVITPQLGSAFFYLLPVLYVSRHASWRAALACAVLACLVSLNADIITERPGTPMYLPFANAALRLGVLLIVVRLVDSLRSLNDSLEARVRDRTARLQAEVRERLKLENHILEIRETEQARIGQDIHDGLCQHLVATAFSTSMLQRKLEEQGSTESGDATEIVGLIDDAITQARDVAKGLYPVRLDEEGLETALLALANGASKRTGLRCSVSVAELPSALSEGTAVQLYRIAQEAVNNTLKHADASELDIEFESSIDSFDLRIRDNGKGMKAEARSGLGMGLHIMEYRAKAIGAKLEIAPNNGRGVIVRCVSNHDSPDHE